MKWNEVHTEKTRENSRNAKNAKKRKKYDHLSASFLWLTYAQNFNHGSYIALVEIIIRQR